MTIKTVRVISDASMKEYRSKAEDLTIPEQERPKSAKAMIHLRINDDVTITT